MGNGITAVVLEYLKRKVTEWRYTNAEFVLNITLLLHFTMKVRGIWLYCCSSTSTFADDSSHEIVCGHTLQQEVQSHVAWDRKINATQCQIFVYCLPYMQIQILHHYITG